MSDLGESRKKEEAIQPEVGRPDVDQRALRGALLKLDCFLLPIATLIYFLNFLDR